MVTFMGIAGGLQSLLTPEFTHGLHPVYVFDYFFNHASIVAVGFYIIFGQRNASSAALGCAPWAHTAARPSCPSGQPDHRRKLYVPDGAPYCGQPLIIQSDSFPYMHVVFFQVFAALHFLLLQVILARFKVSKVA